MLDWFHNFCGEYGLNYYVVGGTMLGAIRHGGFIPWDDDIDVVLPRPDYEKLLSLCKGQIEHYLLESPYSGRDDYFYTCAKLYDTDTTLIEKAKYTCKRGIYIDIFPLDGLGNTIKQAYSNFRKVDKVNVLLKTRTCAVLERRGVIKNASIIFSQLIPSFIINDHKLILKVDKMASSFGFENSLYVANLMGAYRKKEVMEKSVFGVPKDYKFENITVKGVEHYEVFLNHIYGDWRTLPPIEKRNTTHEYQYIDLNKSFLTD